MTSPKPSLTLQPARLATGTADETTFLVLADARITAVLVRLDDPCHGEDQGHWFLEAGFGRCASSPAAFAGIADALGWIAERLGLAQNVDATVAQAEHALTFTPAGGTAAAPPHRAGTAY